MYIEIADAQATTDNFGNIQKVLWGEIITIYILSKNTKISLWRTVGLEY